MLIRRFEDLECWQEARKLTQIIYQYTASSNFHQDFRLTGQITGAAISIMNNISEGFDSGARAEFTRFLQYSRRSCSEVQNCLYIASDLKYINDEYFQEAYQYCENIR